MEKEEKVSQDAEKSKKKKETFIEKESLKGYKSDNYLISTLRFQL